MIPPIQVADMAAGGMYAALGILAAVIARQKTGEGQYIDISMLDGIIAMLPFPASLYGGWGKDPRRGETLLSGRYPCYGVYETREGKYISIGALEPRFWEALVENWDGRISSPASMMKLREVFGSIFSFWLEIKEVTGRIGWRSRRTRECRLPERSSTGRSWTTAVVSLEHGGRIFRRCAKGKMSLLASPIKADLGIHGRKDRGPAGPAHP